VQCATTGSPSTKTCDMAQVQVAEVQGKKLPFSRLAVLRPVKGQPVRLIIQVPVNISLSKKVLVQTADADPGVEAPFARCVQTGCFADLDLQVDAFKKFRTAPGPGKLSFADAGGHAIVIPLSFKGFAPAFDALAKE